MTAPLDQALARLRGIDPGWPGLITAEDASAVLDALAQAERERDEKDVFRSVLLGQVHELEAELAAVRQERDTLRKALAAYRSALRCGERESAQLEAMGDAALAGGTAARKELGTMAALRRQHALSRENEAAQETSG